MVKCVDVFYFLIFKSNRFLVFGNKMNIFLKKKYRKLKKKWKKVYVILFFIISILMFVRLLNSNCYCEWNIFFFF